MQRYGTVAWENGNYQFAPVVEAHLPLLHRWLGEPHVREWWGEPDHEIELIKENFTLSWIDSFLVSYRERPFGYIQCYDIFSDDYQPFPDQSAGTHGIDQFIGEPDMINRGHGSGFISAFASSVLSGGVPRIVTDPDPDNARAIAAYKKAEFRALDQLDTEWGPCLLMARDAVKQAKA